MRCQFCHNPDTWNPAARGQYQMTPEELLTEVRRYRSFIKNGGVTVSGGEPLMQADFVCDFLRLCKEAGLHTALDTSGVIFSAKVREVLEHVDLVLLDIKTVDENFHKEYTGHTAASNRQFLDYLQQTGKPVWIRHVVVPQRTYDEAQLRMLGQMLRGYSVIEKVELLPYHTMGRYKWDNLGIDYPLEGVPDLTATEIAHARGILAEYGFQCL